MSLNRTRWSRLQHVPFARALLVAAFVTIAAPALSLARAGNMPDLRGVWKATYVTPTQAGRVVREASFEITRQDGELFWGMDIWQPIDPKSGKALPKSMRNPILGSLSPSGDRGLYTSRGVQFAFRLKGPDEMELEMASFEKLGGLEPTAFYAVLKRGAVGAVSRANYPDLSGSWRGRCVVAEPAGLRSSSVRLDLVRQDGQLLWMDDVWSPSGHVTRTTDRKSVLRERMMGSFDPAGTGGVLAKKDVRMGFKLLAPDRMEVEFVRVGGKQEPPTAFYAVLRKGGDESPVSAAKGVNLVGTWTASYRWILPDRPVEAASTLAITRQEGNALWAEDVWTQPGEKGAAPVERRDPMCGSLSPDQTHGALAKSESFFSFRVLDADHLEVAFTAIEDKPTAFFGVFTRKH